MSLTPVADAYTTLASGSLAWMSMTALAVREPAVEPKIALSSPAALMLLSGPLALFLALCASSNTSTPVARLGLGLGLGLGSGSGSGLGLGLGVPSKSSPPHH